MENVTHKKADDNWNDLHKAVEEKVENLVKEVGR